MASDRKHDWNLWYKQPASVWEEALPIGNGRLGGMVFGGIQEERIALNEDTLWAGFPRDTVNYEARRHLERARSLIFECKYAEAQKLVDGKMLGRDCQPYLPLGNLMLTRRDGANVGADNLSVERYRRELSLANGLASVEYRSNGIAVQGEYFASVPDQVICIRYVALEGELNYDIALDSPLRYTTVAEGDSLVMSGRAPSHISDNYLGDHPAPVVYEDGLGMLYEARLRVESDGNVQAGEGKLEVRKASQVIVYLAATTGFVDYRTAPDESGLSERCVRTLSARRNADTKN
ncbi:glycoside hydrolase family 95 protein [Cohnella cholangitidis]|uniref:glycoside hydrolase family 95 protein n=1 Tax=Cohnella cholangitidis TaxID=2598458 RepID=UPI001E6247B7|nr:glycoside hydrolase family 95 protein [Cohnella cholangitidis]